MKKSNAVFWFLPIVFAISVTLLGCGGPTTNSTTSTSTTVTTTSTTTTTNTTITTTTTNHELVDDFYSKTGVAFTKLTHTTWSDGPGSGGSVNEDTAPFFKSWNNAQQANLRQAMTVTNSKKWMWPYHGGPDGYSQWGLVFSLREDAGYWKYFMTSDACTSFGAPLMASCGDCLGHCCGRDVGDDLAGDSLSFAEWDEHKNQVIQASGYPKNQCQLGYSGDDNPGNHGWNEFSSNGLSYDALVGVIVDQTGNGENGAPPMEYPPPEDDVCNFLKTINTQRRTKIGKWPIFDYTVDDYSSDLTFLRYLDCDDAEASSHSIVV